jgi:hypothetical protein
MGLEKDRRPGFDAAIGEHQAVDDVGLRFVRRNLLHPGDQRRDHLLHRVGGDVGDGLVDLWVVDPGNRSRIRSDQARVIIISRAPGPESPLTIFARMLATRPVFWITGAALDHAVRT